MLDTRILRLRRRCWSAIRGGYSVSVEGEMATLGLSTKKCSDPKAILVLLEAPSAEEVTFLEADVVPAAEPEAFLPPLIVAPVVEEPPPETAREPLSIEPAVEPVTEESPKAVEPVAAEPAQALDEFLGEETDKPMSEAELSKKNKRELLELAASKGVDISDEDTKRVIIQKLLG